MADSAADKVDFDLVTPLNLVASEQVDMVVVPGGAGDFGVLPGHAPLISTVRPGVVEADGDGKAAAETELRIAEALVLVAGSGGDVH